MDLGALASNVRRSMALCPTWRDRRQYLASLYSHWLPPSLAQPQGRWIAFDFGGDVGRVRLAVRDNRGADTFVLGEMFGQRSYDVPLNAAPKTVLDLGANVGYAAVFFARRYPHAAVACVEPEPDNVRLLRLNLEANAVQAHVVPAAIAVFDGSTALQLSDRGYGHKVAGIPYGRPLHTSQIRVDAMSVPTLLGRLNWDRIGLLKMDIEGYEGVLLTERADWLSRVDAMCIECHEGFSLEDLADVGARWGFGPVRRENATLLLERT